MYVTKSGDQWDMIAKEVYGSEMHTDWLMQNNMLLLDIFQFDSGVELNTPDLPVAAQTGMPPWRIR